MILFILIRFREIRHCRRLNIYRMTESPYFQKRITRSKICRQLPVVIESKDGCSKSKVLNKKQTSNDAEQNIKRKPKVNIKYEHDADVEIAPSDDNETIGKKVKLEPISWKDQLDNIYEMRKDRDAPVDSMGCDVISDKNASPEEYRYQVLISLMLSSQTKDQVTSAAMAKLRKHGCSINNVLKTPDNIIGELIYPVGFWKRKIQYIKKTTVILKNQYNGDIPDTVEDLCKLPGVGPKMAYLVMKCAWNKVQGIGVDTHVHRIANRLKWVKTKEPEQTRVALESWLPSGLALSSWQEFAPVQAIQRHRSDTNFSFTMSTYEGILGRHKPSLGRIWTANLSSCGAKVFNMPESGNLPCW